MVRSQIPVRRKEAGIPACIRQSRAIARVCFERQTVSLHLARGGTSRRRKAASPNTAHPLSRCTDALAWCRPP